VGDYQHRCTSEKSPGQKCFDARGELAARPEEETTVPKDRAIISPE
jgi:hypothetical protein